MTTLKLFPTRDQSYTLYVEELDETYHSRNGALEESNHVFIKHGLHEVAKNKTQIRILEIGFGTGLNAILSCIEATKLGLDIEYYALETYPLSHEWIEALAYSSLLIHADDQANYTALHACKWDTPAQINSNFKLIKIQESLLHFHTSTTFDLIYFDAFAPEKQPELWTLDVFKKLYAAQSREGIWVSYSSKGQVKRDLKTAGYVVERLPGPPFKRHMLRAVKP